MQIELSSVGVVGTAIASSVAVGGTAGAGSAPADGGFASVLRSSIGTEAKTGGSAVANEAKKPGGEIAGGKAVPVPAAPISLLKQRLISAAVPMPESVGGGAVVAKPVNSAAAAEQEALQPKGEQIESDRSDSARIPLKGEGVSSVVPGVQQTGEASNLSRVSIKSGSAISGLDSGPNAGLNSKGLAVAAKVESSGVPKNPVSVKKTVEANAVGSGSSISTKAGEGRAGLAVASQTGEAISLKGTAQPSDVSAVILSGQTTQSGLNVIPGGTGGVDSAVEQGAQFTPVFQAKPDLLEGKSAGSDVRSLSNESGQSSPGAEPFFANAQSAGFAAGIKGNVSPAVHALPGAKSPAGTTKPETSSATEGNAVAAAGVNRGSIAKSTVADSDGPQGRSTPAHAELNLPQGLSSGSRPASAATDAADRLQFLDSPVGTGADADLQGASTQPANKGPAGESKALTVAQKVDSTSSSAAALAGGHAGVQSGGTPVQGEGVAGSSLPSVATAGHGIALAAPQLNPASVVGTPSLLSSTSRFAEALEAGSNSGSASGSNVRLLHASPQAMEVGVLDGDRGWLEVRAERAGGNLTASLAANSSGSAEALSQVVPDLAGYLRDRHIAVEQILVSGGTSGSSSHGMGGGPAGGMPGGMAGSMTGGMASGMGSGNPGGDGSSSAVVPGVLRETGSAPVSSASSIGGPAARIDVSHHGQISVRV